MRKGLSTLLLLFSFLLVAGAQERTPAQMQQLARQVLKSMDGHKAKGKAEASVAPSKLFDTDHIAVYGYQDGGMVFLSKNAQAEPVLGFSPTMQSDTLPEGLQWWLEAMDEVMKKEPARRRTIQAPMTEVLPLLTSKWNQRAPFNNNLVYQIGGKSYQFVTGCVATAMAQVMYYYKYPEVGRSFHEYDISYADVGTCHFASDMQEHRYKWDLMRDSYTSAPANDAAAEAVAVLMKDAGISVGMKYNSNASSSSTSDVSGALRNHFRYSRYTRTIERIFFDSDSWMQTIFRELDEHRPVIYSGNDSDAGGHAFIVDGYNSQGLVHVNWGWSGRYDGYYNMDLMNPDDDQYSERQMAVIGIQPLTQELITKTVTLTTAGTLSSLLTAEEKRTVERLIVKGPINGADVKVIRFMMGLTDTEELHAWSLVELDLSGARIVSSDDKYGQYDDRTYDDVFPESLVFAIYKQDDGSFVRHIGLCSLIMPTTITQIRSYSVAAAYNMTVIDLPASLTQMDGYPYRFMAMGLRKVVSRALTPPVLQQDVFSMFSNLGEIDLFVPEKAIDAYKADDRWNGFYRILSIESDTTDTVPVIPPQPIDTTGQDTTKQEELPCRLAQIDGLWYVLCQDSALGAQAQLTYMGDTYNPDNNYKELYSLQVPEQVKYEGTEYTVVSIGDSAMFNALHLESVELPASVVMIGKSSFGNTRLSSVVSRAATPPVFAYYSYADSLYLAITNANEVFYRQNWGENRLLKADVFVPALSVEAYKTAVVWQELNIQALSVTDGVSNLSSEDYTINGNNLTVSQPFSLYGIHGQTLYQGRGTQLTLPDGIYLLQIEGQTYKLVICR